MTDEIWRRYARIWSLSPGDRERELAACVSTDVSYADPNIVVSGRAAFSEYMAGFQRGFPGHEFRIRAVRTHHGRSVARWDQVDASGNIVAPGVSFALTNEEGRLASIHGFFGDVEELLG